MEWLKQLSGGDFRNLDKHVLTHESIPKIKFELCYFGRKSV